MFNIVKTNLCINVSKVYNINTLLWFATNQCRCNFPLLEVLIIQINGIIGLYKEIGLHHVANALEKHITLFSNFACQQLRS